MKRTWKLEINSFLSTLGDKRSGLKNLCSADLKSFRCTLLGRNPSTLEMEEFKRLLNTPWGITDLGLHTPTSGKPLFFSFLSLETVDNYRQKSPNKGPAFLLFRFFASSEGFQQAGLSHCLCNCRLWHMIPYYWVS